MVLDIERDGEFAILSLNRPKALNALSEELVGAIDAALDDIDASDARAVIFTGSGDKSFCAGADIKEFSGKTVSGTRAFIRNGQRVFARLDTFRMPSFAMINGYCFGGGLELATACTFRLATPNAKLGVPEIKLGLIPGYGGTQRLPRLVGHTKALEMVMSGRTVDADEALAIGLVSRIVDGDPVAAAKEFAQQFTCFGLPALALGRDAVMRAGDLPLDAGLKAEADLNCIAFQTEDAAEGIAAFIEKRPAEFKDA